MRDYELTLVLDPEALGEKRKKFLAKVTKFVKDLKGKIGKTDEWGERELAYPIKKQNLGFYYFLILNLPEKGPGELSKKLKLEESLLRYLLVKREKEG